MQQNSSIVALAVRSIKADHAIQQRATLIDGAVLNDYAEAMTAGSVFPPIVVFYDGAVHWLADGYHRLEAANEAGLKEITAEVRPGTKRDATLHACGANRDHGLRRTRADVRRAITTLVTDAEWGQMANRLIAEKVGCSDKTVAAVRVELFNELAAPFRCGNSATEDTDPDPATSENQLRNFRSSDDEAPGIPSVNSLAEAEAGLNAVFNRDTAPPPPPPAKRIGRDGKFRAMPKDTRPASTPNKAVLAMQAAHMVAAALTRMEALEVDLSADDARMVMNNLRAVLGRLEMRFGGEGN
jgi:hypothetical protein